MGIPGGPSLNLGNSYHHEYSESQPPASPQNTLVPVIVPQPPPPATTPVSNPPPQPPTSTTPEECPPEVTQVVVEEDDCDCDPAETEYQKREVGGGKGALGGGPPTRMTIPVGALDRLRNAEQGKKSGIMGGIPGGL